MTDQIETVDRYKGCLLGLAIGDAVGTSVEFSERGTFTPVTDMTGGGPFRLKAGQWTDDTSMALCLAQSLLDKDGFDPADQLDKYLLWYHEGYYSSNGHCFDIGGTTRKGLRSYELTGVPLMDDSNENSSGNGCIMRLAPVPMFFASDREEAIHLSGQSSRTTHGARKAIQCSQLFSEVLVNALTGLSKQDILANVGSYPEYPEIDQIAKGAYLKKNVDAIQGSGYVVPALEAALWSFAVTENYRDAILTAVNLGDDTDTTAAICGQVAGAHYGLAGIPLEWVAKVTMREEILNLAERIYERAWSNED